MRWTFRVARMLEPRQFFFRSLSPHGFHRVAYVEWGDPTNHRVVVCVHGLTRSGRDFDDLARALAPSFRVLCPDVAGRGDSEWLRDPSDYTIATYLVDLATLLAHARVEQVAWVGTSMGGILGMLTAAQPETPIDRLVVNDVGPLLEPAAIVRIGSYVGSSPVFDKFEQLDAYVREISATFGKLTDAQWHHLSRSVAQQTQDGRWKLKYDPGIAVPFRATGSQSRDLWAQWDAIQCPTLVLRGAESDLLSASTAAAMRERGPRAKVVEFPDVGHAPMLLTPDQIAPVVQFLQAMPG